MAGEKAREGRDSPLTQRTVAFLRSRLDKRGLSICLSGIDGSGKTTLARELVHVLNVSGVPARHLHLYQWYVNVLITPIRLFCNRHVDHKVLVFDRSIYDNIAVASLRRYNPRWLSRAALAVVHACYPKFDYRFYLVVGFTESLLRRPDTDKERFALLRKTYDEITVRAQYIRLPSDAHLFAAVLREMETER